MSELIDLEIKDLVDYINDMGVKTVYSCAGGHNDSLPYIVIDVPKAGLPHLIKAVKKNSVKKFKGNNNLCFIINKALSVSLDKYPFKEGFDGAYVRLTTYNGLEEFKSNVKELIEYYAGFTQHKEPFDYHMTTLIAVFDKQLKKEYRTLKRNDREALKFGGSLI